VNGPGLSSTGADGVRVGDTATPTVTGLPRITIVQQPSSTAQSGVPFQVCPILQLTDANGSNLALAGVNIFPGFQGTEGTLEVDAVPYVTDANGRVAVGSMTFTADIGSYVFLFSASGYVQATCNPVQITHGVAAASASTADVPSQVTAGQLVTITLTVRDSAGNVVTDFAGTVQGIVTGGNSASTSNTLENGVATMTYTATNDGVDTVVLRVNGTGIQGSPFTVTVNEVSALYPDLPFVPDTSWAWTPKALTPQSTNTDVAANTSNTTYGIVTAGTHGVRINDPRASSARRILGSGVSGAPAVDTLFPGNPAGTCYEWSYAAGARPGFGSVNMFITPNPSGDSWDEYYEMVEFMLTRSPWVGPGTAGGQHKLPGFWGVNGSSNRIYGILRSSSGTEVVYPGTDPTYTGEVNREADSWSLDIRLQNGGDWSAVPNVSGAFQIQTLKRYRLQMYCKMNTTFATGTSTAALLSGNGNGILQTWLTNLTDAPTVRQGIHNYTGVQWRRSTDPATGFYTKQHNPIWGGAATDGYPLEQSQWTRIAHWYNAFKGQM
jgi:hypothetical protein